MTLCESGSKMGGRNFLAGVSLLLICAAAVLGKSLDSSVVRSEVQVVHFLGPCSLSFVQSSDVAEALAWQNLPENCPASVSMEPRLRKNDPEILVVLHGAPLIIRLAQGDLRASSHVSFIGKGSVKLSLQHAQQVPGLMQLGLLSLAEPVHVDTSHQLMVGVKGAANPDTFAQSTVLGSAVNAASRSLLTASNDTQPECRISTKDFTQNCYEGLFGPFQPADIVTVVVQLPSSAMSIEGQGGLELHNGSSWGSILRASGQETQFNATSMHALDWVLVSKGVGNGTLLLRQEAVSPIAFFNSDEVVNNSILVPRGRNVPVNISMHYSHAASLKDLLAEGKTSRDAVVAAFNESLSSLAIHVEELQMCDMVGEACEGVISNVTHFRRMVSRYDNFACATFDSYGHGLSEGRNAFVLEGGVWVNHTAGQNWTDNCFPLTAVDAFVGRLLHQDFGFLATSPARITVHTPDSNSTFVQVREKEEWRTPAVEFQAALANLHPIHAWQESQTNEIQFEVKFTYRPYVKVANQNVSENFTAEFTFDKDCLGNKRSDKLVHRQILNVSMWQDWQRVHLPFTAHTDRKVEDSCTFMLESVHVFNESSPVPPCLHQNASFPHVNSNNFTILQDDFHGAYVSFDLLNESGKNWTTYLPAPVGNTASLSVAEGMDISGQISLSFNPESSVSVLLELPYPDISNPASTSLEFSPTNWSIPQNFIVPVEKNYWVNGNGSSIFNVSCFNAAGLLFSHTFDVKVTDSDVANFTISYANTVFTEGQTWEFNATFDTRLHHRPNFTLIPSSHSNGPYASALGQVRTLISDLSNVTTTCEFIATKTVCQSNLLLGNDYLFTGNQTATFELVAQFSAPDDGVYNCSTISCTQRLTADFRDAQTLEISSLQHGALVEGAFLNGSIQFKHPVFSNEAISVSLSIDFPHDVRSLRMTNVTKCLNGSSLNLHGHAGCSFQFDELYPNDGYDFGSETYNFSTLAEIAGTKSPIHHGSLTLQDNGDHHSIDMESSITITEASGTQQNSTQSLKLMSGSWPKQHVNVTFELQTSQPDLCRRLNVLPSNRLLEPGSNLTATFIVAHIRDMIDSGNVSCAFTVFLKSADEHYNISQSLHVAIINTDEARIGALISGGLRTCVEGRNCNVAVTLYSKPTHNISFSVQRNGNYWDAYPRLSSVWNASHNVSYLDQAIQHSSPNFTFSIDIAVEEDDYASMNRTEVWILRMDSDDSNYKGFVNISSPRASRVSANSIGYPVAVQDNDGIAELNFDVLEGVLGTEQEEHSVVVRLYEHGMFQVDTELFKSKSWNATNISSSVSYRLWTSPMLDPNSKCNISWQSVGELRAVSCSSNATTSSGTCDDTAGAGQSFVVLKVFSANDQQDFGQTSLNTTVKIVCTDSDRWSNETLELRTDVVSNDEAGIIVFPEDPATHRGISLASNTSVSHRLPYSFEEGSGSRHWTICSRTRPIGDMFFYLAYAISMPFPDTDGMDSPWPEYGSNNMSMHISQAGWGGNMTHGCVVFEIEQLPHDFVRWGDGRFNATLSLVYSGGGLQQALGGRNLYMFNAAVQDKDIAGFSQVSRNCSYQMEEGQNCTHSLRLLSRPGASITVSPQMAFECPGGYKLLPSYNTVVSQNQSVQAGLADWNRTLVFHVELSDDNYADANCNVTISFQVRTADPNYNNSNAPVSLHGFRVDNDKQALIVNSMNTVLEGKPLAVNVSLRHMMRTNATVNVTQLFPAAHLLDLSKQRLQFGQQSDASQYLTATLPHDHMRHGNLNMSLKFTMQGGVEFGDLLQHVPPVVMNFIVQEKDTSVIRLVPEYRNSIQQSIMLNMSNQLEQVLHEGESLYLHFSMSSKPHAWPIVNVNVKHNATQPSASVTSNCTDIQIDSRDFCCSITYSTDSHALKNITALASIVFYFNNSQDIQHFSSNAGRFAVTLVDSSAEPSILVDAPAFAQEGDDVQVQVRPAAQPAGGAVHVICSHFLSRNGVAVTRLGTESLPTLSPPFLTFSSLNWAVNQTVTLVKESDKYFSPEFNANVSCRISSLHAPETDKLHDISNSTVITFLDSQHSVTVSSIPANGSLQFVQEGSCTSYKLNLFPRPRMDVTFNASWEKQWPSKGGHALENNVTFLPTNQELASLNGSAESVPFRAAAEGESLNSTIVLQVCFSEDDRQQGNFTNSMLVVSNSQDPEFHGRHFSFPITRQENDVAAFVASNFESRPWTLEDWPSMNLTFELTTEPLDDVVVSLEYIVSDNGSSLHSQLQNLWSNCSKNLTILNGTPARTQHHWPCNPIVNPLQFWGEQFSVTIRAVIRSDQDDYDQLPVYTRSVAFSRPQSHATVEIITAPQSEGDHYELGIRLQSQPSHTVSVNTTTSATVRTKCRRCDLVFNTVNWSTMQVVDIELLEDTFDFDSKNMTISFNLHSLDQMFSLSNASLCAADNFIRAICPTSISQVVLDDDTHGVAFSLNRSQVSEADEILGIVMELNSTPFVDYSKVAVEVSLFAHCDLDNFTHEPLLPVSQTVQLSLGKGIYSAALSISRDWVHTDNAHCEVTANFSSQDPDYNGISITRGVIISNVDRVGSAWSAPVAVSEGNIYSVNLTLESRPMHPVAANCHHTVADLEDASDLLPRHLVNFSPSNRSVDPGNWRNPLLVSTLSIPDDDGIAFPKANVVLRCLLVSEDLMYNNTPVVLTLQREDAQIQSIEFRVQSGQTTDQSSGYLSVTDSPTSVGVMQVILGAKPYRGFNMSFRASSRDYNVEASGLIVEDVQFSTYDFLKTKQFKVAGQADNFPDGDATVQFLIDVSGSDRLVRTASRAASFFVFNKDFGLILTRLDVLPVNTLSLVAGTVMRYQLSAFASVNSRPVAVTLPPANLQAKSSAPDGCSFEFSQNANDSKLVDADLMCTRAFSQPSIVTFTHAVSGGSEISTQRSLTVLHAPANQVVARSLSNDLQAGGEIYVSAIQILDEFRNEVELNARFRVSRGNTILQEGAITSSELNLQQTIAGVYSVVIISNENSTLQYSHQVVVRPGTVDSDLSARTISISALNLNAGEKLQIKGRLLDQYGNDVNGSMTAVLSASHALVASKSISQPMVVSKSGSYELQVQGLQGMVLTSAAVTVGPDLNSLKVITPASPVECYFNTSCTIPFEILDRFDNQALVPALEISCSMIAADNTKHDCTVVEGQGFLQYHVAGSIALQGQSLKIAEWKWQGNVLPLSDDGKNWIRFVDTRGDTDWSMDGSSRMTPPADCAAGTRCHFEVILKTSKNAAPNTEKVAARFNKDGRIQATTSVFSEVDPSIGLYRGFYDGLTASGQYTVEVFDTANPQNKLQSAPVLRVIPGAASKFEFVSASQVSPVVGLEGVIGLSVKDAHGNVVSTADATKLVIPSISVVVSAELGNALVSRDLYQCKSPIWQSPSLSIGCTIHNVGKYVVTISSRVEGLQAISAIFDVASGPACAARTIATQESSYSLSDSRLDLKAHLLLRNSLGMNATFQGDEFWTIEGDGAWQNRIGLFRRISGTKPCQKSEFVVSQPHVQYSSSRPFESTVTFGQHSEAGIFDICASSCNNQDCGSCGLQSLGSIEVLPGAAVEVLVDPFNTIGIIAGSQQPPLGVYSRDAFGNSFVADGLIAKHSVNSLGAQFQFNVGHGSLSADGTRRTFSLDLSKAGTHSISFQVGSQQWSSEFQVLAGSISIEHSSFTPIRTGVPANASEGHVGDLVPRDRFGNPTADLGELSLQVDLQAKNFTAKSTSGGTLSIMTALTRAGQRDIQLTLSGKSLFGKVLVLPGQFQRLDITPSQVIAAPGDSFSVTLSFVDTFGNPVSDAYALGKQSFTTDSAHLTAFDVEIGRNQQSASQELAFQSGSSTIAATYAIQRNGIHFGSFAVVPSTVHSCKLNAGTKLTAQAENVIASVGNAVCFDPFGNRAIVDWSNVRFTAQDPEVSITGVDNNGAVNATGLLHAGTHSLLASFPGSHTSLLQFTIEPAQPVQAIGRVIVQGSSSAMPEVYVELVDRFNNTVNNRSFAESSFNSSCEGVVVDTSLSRTIGKDTILAIAGVDRDCPFELRVNGIVTSAGNLTRSGNSVTPHSWLGSYVAENSLLTVAMFGSTSGGLASMRGPAINCSSYGQTKLVSISCSGLQINSTISTCRGSDFIWNLTHAVQGCAQHIRSNEDVHVDLIAANRHLSSIQVVKFKVSPVPNLLSLELQGNINVSDKSVGEVVSVPFRLVGNDGNAVQGLTLSSNEESFAIVANSSNYILSGRLMPKHSTFVNISISGTRHVLISGVAQPELVDITTQRVNLSSSIVTAGQVVNVVVDGNVRFNAQATLEDIATNQQVGPLVKLSSNSKGLNLTKAGVLRVVLQDAVSGKRRSVGLVTVENSSLKSITCQTPAIARVSQTWTARCALEDPFGNQLLVDSSGQYKASVVCSDQLVAEMVGRGSSDFVLFSTTFLTVRSSCTLQFSYGGRTATSSIFNIQAGTVSILKSGFTVTPIGDACSGHILVEFRINDDKFNRVIPSQADVKIELLSPNGQTTTTQVSSHTVHLSTAEGLLLSGTYMISVTVDGVQLRNSPMQITMPPGPLSAQRSSLTLFKETITAGERVQASLTPLDQCGNLYLNNTVSLSNGFGNGLVIGQSIKWDKQATVKSDSITLTAILSGVEVSQPVRLQVKAAAPSQGTISTTSVTGLSVGGQAALNVLLKDRFSNSVPSSADLCSYLRIEMVAKSSTYLLNKPLTTLSSLTTSSSGCNVSTILLTPGNIDLSAALVQLGTTQPLALDAASKRFNVAPSANHAIVCEPACTSSSPAYLVSVKDDGNNTHVQYSKSLTIDGKAGKWLNGVMQFTGHDGTKRVSSSNFHLDLRFTRESSFSPDSAQIMSPVVAVSGNISFQAKKGNLLLSSNEMVGDIICLVNGLQIYSRKSGSVLFACAIPAHTKPVSTTVSFVFIDSAGIRKSLATVGLHHRIDIVADCMSGVKPQSVKMTQAGFLASVEVAVVDRHGNQINAYEQICDWQSLDAIRGVKERNFTVAIAGSGNLLVTAPASIVHAGEYSLFSTPVLQIVAGPADIRQSSVTPSSSVATAGVPLIITLSAKDRFGNAALPPLHSTTIGNLTVQSAQQSDTLTLSASNDHAELVVTFAGYSMPLSPVKMPVKPGIASSARWESVPVSVFAGSESQVCFQTFDNFGNPSRMTAAESQLLSRTSLSMIASDQSIGDVSFLTLSAFAKYCSSTKFRKSGRFSLTVPVLHSVLSFSSEINVQLASAPSVLASQLDSTLMKIDIMFDRDTDFGSSQAVHSNLCQDWHIFSDSTITLFGRNSQCSWQSRRHLRVRLTDSSTVGAGSVISFANNKIYTYLGSSFESAQASLPVTTTALVDPPTAITVDRPVPSIVMQPQVSKSCDVSVSMAYSGGTRGMCARWFVRSINGEAVSSSHALQTFLRTQNPPSSQVICTSVLSKLLIPKSALQNVAGAVVLEVQLSDVSQQSGRTSKQFLVVQGEQAISVTFEESALSAFQGLPISIQPRVNYGCSSFDQNQVQQKTSFEWTCIDGSCTSDISAYLSDITSANLFLPKSLIPSVGSFVTIQVNASLGTGQWSTADVSVNGRLPKLAVSMGGNRVIDGSSNDLTLTVSIVDEFAQNVESTYSIIQSAQFSFSCQVISDPNLQAENDCSHRNKPVTVQISESLKSVTIPKLFLPPSATVQWTASSIVDGQRLESSVTITTIPGSAPSIILVGTALQSNTLADRYLAVENSDQFKNFKWTVQSLGSFEEVLTDTGSVPHLLRLPHSLSPDTRLNVSVSARYVNDLSQVSSTSTIISSPEAPFGGRCSVSSSSVAQFGALDLECVGWQPPENDGPAYFQWLQDGVQIGERKRTASFSHSFDEAGEIRLSVCIQSESGIEFCPPTVHTVQVSAATCESVSMELTKAKNSNDAARLLVLKSAVASSGCTTTEPITDIASEVKDIPSTPASTLFALNVAKKIGSQTLKKPFQFTTDQFAGAFSSFSSVQSSVLTKLGRVPAKHKAKAIRISLENVGVMASLSRRMVSRRLLADSTAGDAILSSAETAARFSMQASLEGEEQRQSVGGITIGTLRVSQTVAGANSITLDQSSVQLPSTSDVSGQDAVMVTMSDPFQRLGQPSYSTTPHARSQDLNVLSLSIFNRSELGTSQANISRSPEPFFLSMPSSCEGISGNCIDSCRYWSSSLSKWSSKGCISEESRTSGSKCRCYHLTAFTSMAQDAVPNSNTVDPIGDAALVGAVDRDDILSVIFMACMFGLWLLGCMWGIKKDRVERREFLKNPVRYITDHEGKVRRAGFPDILKHAFRNEHLLYTVFTIRPYTPISRPMQITCLFSYLFGSMLANALFTNRDPRDIGYVQAVSAGVTTALIVLPAAVLFVAMFRKVSRYRNILANRSGMRKKEAIIRKKPIPMRLAKYAAKKTPGESEYKDGPATLPSTSVTDTSGRVIKAVPAPKVQNPDDLKVNIGSLKRAGARKDLKINEKEAFELLWSIKRKYNISQKPNYNAISERLRADKEQRGAGSRLWGKVRATVNVAARKDHSSGGKFMEVLRAAQRKSEMKVISTTTKEKNEQLPHRLLMLTWLLVGCYFTVCLYVNLLFVIKFEGAMVAHWLRASFTSAAIDLLILDPIKIALLAYIPFAMSRKSGQKKFVV